MALDQKKKSQNVLKYVNKQMSLLLIILYVSQIVFCLFFTSRWCSPVVGSEAPCQTSGNDLGHYRSISKHSAAAESF